MRDRDRPFTAIQRLALLIGLPLFTIMTSVGHALGDEPIDQSQPTVSLAVLSETRIHLVTDDDFLLPTAAPWCQRSLERAIDQCETQRPNKDLKLNFIPAGSPGILNRSRPKTGPRRAICLITDSGGLVYAFCIGVPSGNQLISLLEDADDLQLSVSMGAIEQEADPESEVKNHLVTLVRERSSKRTIRHYLPLLEKIREDLALNAGAEILAPAVQLDLAERFHLTPPIDGDRLVSTQQHVESSRYWCDAMLPCVVGKPIDTVWPELANIVWNAQPWRLSNDSEMLASWYESTIKDRPLVVEIAEDPKSPHLGVSASVGPRNPKAIEKRDQVDAAIESKISEIAVYRRLSLPEFAALLTHRTDRPIDILINPSARPRWFALQSAKAEAQSFPAAAGDRLIAQVERWISGQIR